MKFLVRIIFILFISVNIFAQDNLSRMKKIKIIEEKNQGKYIVLGYAFGNFVSADEESVFVLLDNWKNRLITPSVSKMVVYNFRNNKITKQIVLKERCNVYKDGLQNYYLTHGITGMNEWPIDIYNFGFVGDFNNNGLDELVLHVDSNLEGTTILIKEFQNGSFKTILEPENDICLLKNFNPKLKSLSFLRTVYDSKSDTFSDSIKNYEWNEIEKKYQQCN